MADLVKFFIINKLEACGVEPSTRIENTQLIDSAISLIARIA